MGEGIVDPLTTVRGSDHDLSLSPLERLSGCALTRRGDFLVLTVKIGRC